MTENAATISKLCAYELRTFNVFLYPVQVRGNLGVESGFLRLGTRAISIISEANHAHELPYSIGTPALERSTAVAVANSLSALLKAGTYHTVHVDLRVTAVPVWPRADVH